MTDIPLSLYVHVPWCVRKCPYCDFNSHQQQGELPEQSYVDALLQDLDCDLAGAQGRPLQSIFIGGGTPSLFSAQSYQRLLQQLAKRLRFADDIEITLEANPGTFEQAKFRDFRDAGINRLSIGIQSFDAQQLTRLGRIHGRDEALRAADIAHNAGFDNFNLDLMFALPQQTQEQALADLRTALSCNPTHLSWYQLTIEPNTEFFSRPPVQPTDDAIADTQQAGIELLASEGFQRYEISAFAKQGKRSRHNLNYWEFGDYLGIGAGAHGKLSHIANDGSLIIERTRKTRMPQHYLAAKGAYCVERKQVPAQELPLEFMLNALRLCDGVQTSSYQARTGAPITSVAAALQQLRQRGLLQTADSMVAPTALGLQFLNDALVEFM